MGGSPVPQPQPPPTRRRNTLAPPNISGLPLPTRRPLRQFLPYRFRSGRKRFTKSSTAMPRRNPRRLRPYLAESDRAVVRERPVRVVGDLPHVAIGVGKGPGVAAPVGAGSRASDRCAGALGGSEERVDLLGRTNVMGQLDPGCAVAAKRRP